jgi:dTMP kinase
MFVTFEGLDFSGKTTQARLLVEKLKALPITTEASPGPQRTSLHESPAIVHFLREPGGTQISERIREILLDNRCREMTDLAEMLLFSASRTQLVSEVIMPALQRGEIVVCDRFFDSTTAYQGFGRGLDIEAIAKINRIATLGLMPDLTILIDIPVGEIEQRKIRAGLHFDRMEASGKEFYEKVRKGYLEIARNEADRFAVLDGTLPIDEVASGIWQAVERRLAGKTISQSV